MLPGRRFVQDGDMSSTGHDYVPNELLGRLVGFRLYSVQFVLDHVQLRFDGPTQDLPVLTCDAMPAVVTEAGAVPDGQRDYADALRSLIAGTVINTAEATGAGLRIDLDRGSIVLHPTADDLPGPEIAMLSGFKDGRWMCWRPGEDSFEDLR